MKRIPYKLPKSLVIAELRGREVLTNEAETLDEFKATLVEAEPSTEGNVLKLAQGQFDIIQQRWIREYLDSEDGQKYFAEHGADKTLAAAQQIADEARYGGKERKTSAATAKTKASVSFADQVLEASKTNPAALDKLRKMGFDVDALLAAAKAAETEKAEKAAKAAGDKTEAQPQA